MPTLKPNDWPHNPNRPLAQSETLRPAQGPHLARALRVLSGGRSNETMFVKLAALKLKVRDTGLEPPRPLEILATTLVSEIQREEAVEVPCTEIAKLRSDGLKLDAVSTGYEPS
eukprot:3935997-Rhodomonas_salina.1